MEKIGRRFVLGAAVAGVGVVSTGIGNNGNKAHAGTTTQLRALITLNGVKYDFRQENGQSLGDFISPIGGFTQSCIRTRVSGCPITVFFRPDANTSRAEIVFELADLFNSIPVNLGTYSVVIYRGTAVAASITVPKHYWFSRWRWQSAPRPVVADIDNLIAQNLLPPYDREIVNGALSTTTKKAGTYVTGSITTSTSGTTGDPYTTFVPYTIMGLAGVTPYMPQTGERDDIGLVTECQGAYICTADQTALDQLRAQAEACGTIPWHMRDENTGAPISLRQYPTATWYSGNLTGLLPIKRLATSVTVDSAHMPALAYLPYLLTGDPYHLEDLQFQATWNLGCLVPQYRFSVSQPRQFAWNLRTLAQCARITPASVPAWLLPQSYWRGFLEEQRTHFEDEIVDSPLPWHAIFRTTRNIVNSPDNGPTAPAGTWSDPWEDEFVAAVLGWVNSMGFTQWRRSFDWIIGSTFARTGGTSGWIRAQATPYRMVLRASATSAVATSWAGAWQLAQTVAKLTYSDPNKWIPEDMTYLTYSRGALVYAEKLQASSNTANLNWATTQLNNRDWPTAYKWRVGTGLN